MKRKSTSDLGTSSKKNKKKESTSLFLESGRENLNENLTSILYELGQIEKSKGENYRFRAYMVAVQSLKQYPKKVESGEEAKKLPGIGDKIAKKVQEIIDTGKLKKLDTELSDPIINAINALSKVPYIGPTKAKQLVLNDNIKSIEELRKNTHLLNKNQLIGLKHLDDFQLKIPREELKNIYHFAKKNILEVDSQFLVKCCGSYRRKAEKSGDIDILVSHNDKVHFEKNKKNILKSIIEKLKHHSFIFDDLALSENKYMGVCRYDLEKPARRIDITIFSPGCFYTGLLYFTGSGEHNRQMRIIALEKGYKLSEFGLYPIGQTGVEGDPVLITCEKDVFDILQIPYKEPKDRDFSI